VRDQCLFVQRVVQLVVNAVVDVVVDVTARGAGPPGSA